MHDVNLSVYGYSAQHCGCGKRVVGCYATHPSKLQGHLCVCVCVCAHTCVCGILSSVAFRVKDRMRLCSESLHAFYSLTGFFSFVDGSVHFHVFTNSQVRQLEEQLRIMDQTLKALMASEEKVPALTCAYIYMCVYCTNCPHSWAFQ